MNGGREVVIQFIDLIIFKEIFVMEMNYLLCAIFLNSECLECYFSKTEVQMLFSY